MTEPKVTHTRVTSAAMHRRPVRVALLGMYGSANIGDVAIQLSTMAALRARRPDIEFVGVCTDPADAVTTFGMRARAISGFGSMHVPNQIAPTKDTQWYETAHVLIQRAASQWRIRHHVREFDMLVVSGSGQIDDFWGGPWAQPQRLLYWTQAARRLNLPMAYFGVGVDQLRTAEGQRMVTSAMAMADLRVLRDAGSLAALQSHGLQAACDVCADPAFHTTLPWSSHVASPRSPSFAVISPIARNAWPAGAGPDHGTYIEVLAKCADHLQALGIQVRFVCSQTRMDPPVVDRIQAAMKSDSSKTVVQTPTGVPEYLHAVRGARLVLASRLHALILAMVAGTPVVAISYARKVRQQMLDAGLEPFDLPYEDLDSRSPLPLIDRALGEQDSLSVHLSQVVTRNRHELSQRFDRLAELIP